MAAAPTRTVSMDEVRHLVPDLETIYRAEQGLKPGRVAVFLAARGLSCSRRTLRSLCDRVIGVGDIGGSPAREEVSFYGYAGDHKKAGW